jgi:hypothetical protein
MNSEKHQQATILYAASTRFLAGLLFAVVLSGCTSTTPIVADDPHVFLPSLRVAVSLDDDKQAAAYPQTGHAVEFGYARAKGHGDQSLATGQDPIHYNDTTFTVPQQLRNDFDLNYVDLSFRWRKFFKERSLGLEVSGGIGHTSFGLSVTSLTQIASNHFSTYGPQGGVAFIWRMRPGTSLHVRVSGFVSKSYTGIRDFGRYELFVAQALGDNLALRAGYTKWDVNGDAGVGQSNFRATFSGPVLDLGLNF